MHAVDPLSYVLTSLKHLGRLQIAVPCSNICKICQVMYAGSFFCYPGLSSLQYLATWQFLEHMVAEK